MPTYEYECPKGHVFELFQKMSDPARKKCPKCGKMAVRKISAGAGLLFKGEGFYITDNRPESYKKEAKFEVPGSTYGGGGGGGGGKSEGGSSEPSEPAASSRGSSASSRSSANKPSSASVGRAKPSGTKGGAAKSSGGKKGRK